MGGAVDTSTRAEKRNKHDKKEKKDKRDKKERRNSVDVDRSEGDGLRLGGQGGLIEALRGPDLHAALAAVDELMAVGAEGGAWRVKLIVSFCSSSLLDKKKGPEALRSVRVWRALHQGLARQPALVRSLGTSLLRVCAGALEVEDAGLRECVMGLLGFLFTESAEALFRPTMDDTAVVLKMLLLQCRKPEGPLELACRVCEVFRSRQEQHSNQRKVFNVVVSTLLEAALPLLGVGTKATTGAAEGQERLADVLKEVVFGALFHTDHIAEYPLVLRENSGVGKSEESPPPTKRQKEDEGKPPRGAEDGPGGNYHRQFFTTLQSLVAGETGSLVMAAMPALMDGFVQRWRLHVHALQQANQAKEDGGGAFGGTANARRRALKKRKERESSTAVEFDCFQKLLSIVFDLSALDTPAGGAPSARSEAVRPSPTKSRKEEAEEEEEEAEEEDAMEEEEEESNWEDYEDYSATVTRDVPLLTSCLKHMCALISSANTMALYSGDVANEYQREYLGEVLSESIKVCFGLPLARRIDLCRDGLFDLFMELGEMDHRVTEPYLGVIFNAILHVSASDENECRVAATTCAAALVRNYSKLRRLDTLVSSLVESAEEIEGLASVGPVGLRDSLVEVLATVPRGQITYIWEQRQAALSRTLSRCLRSGDAAESGHRRLFSSIRVESTVMSWLVQGISVDETLAKQILARGLAQLRDDLVPALQSKAIWASGGVVASLVDLVVAVVECVNECVLNSEDACASVDWPLFVFPRGLITNLASSTSHGIAALAMARLQLEAAAQTGTRVVRYVEESSPEVESMRKDASEWLAARINDVAEGSPDGWSDRIWSGRADMGSIGHETEMAVSVGAVSLCCRQYLKFNAVASSECQQAFLQMVLRCGALRGEEGQALGDEVSVVSVVRDLLATAGFYECQNLRKNLPVALLRTVAEDAAVLLSSGRKSKQAKTMSLLVKTHAVVLPDVKEPIEQMRSGLRNLGAGSSADEKAVEAAVSGLSAAVGVAGALPAGYLPPESVGDVLCGLVLAECSLWTVAEVVQREAFAAALVGLRRADTALSHGKGEAQVLTPDLLVAMMDSSRAGGHSLATNATGRALNKLTVRLLTEASSGKGGGHADALPEFLARSCGFEAGMSSFPATAREVAEGMAIWAVDTLQLTSAVPPAALLESVAKTVAILDDTTARYIEQTGREGDAFTAVRVVLLMHRLLQRGDLPVVVTPPRIQVGRVLLAALRALSASPAAPPEEAVFFLSEVCEGWSLFTPPLSKGAHAMVVATLLLLLRRRETPLTVAHWNVQRISDDAAISRYSVDSTPLPLLALHKVVLHCNREQFLGVLTNVRQMLLSGDVDETSDAMVLTVVILKTLHRIPRVRIINQQLTILLAACSQAMHKFISSNPTDPHAQVGRAVVAAELAATVLSRTRVLTVTNKEYSLTLQLLQSALSYLSLLPPGEADGLAGVEATLGVHGTVMSLVQRVLMVAIKHHPNSTVACVATFLQLCNGMLDILSACGAVLAPLLGGPVTSETKRLLADQVARAAGVSRLYEVFSTLGSRVKKYCVHLLSRYLYAVQNAEFGHTEAKETLKPGVFAVMDVCSEHDFKHLVQTVDAGCKGAFKSLFKEYEKDHKYTGKV